jgi:hypothetical protein
MSRKDDCSIIAVDKFIQATRDSGYKGTESAVAELVDNSLQAGARKVAIEVAVAEGEEDYPMRISVLDDGCGMDRATLRQALRFGGSSRFNDRTGLGRYGMGLPNSSLSQARRVEVFSWRRVSSALYCYLDVDEIAAGDMIEVPEPRSRVLPPWVGRVRTPTGTLVVWTRCDRLDHRRVSTIVRRLFSPMGRIFRYFLWDRVLVTVNGTPVEPLDPLYLDPRSARRGGTRFGKPLEYMVEARNGNGVVNGTGKVTVTFSELPVHEWHQLPNEEKRRLGIVNGAGVSVVRAGREIDYGWFFLDGKRRENYDDWWRAEIRFDAILDEAFGITHTKQQIRPQEYLAEILTPDLENLAKALNGRVRQAHLHLKAANETAEVERVASDRDQLLNPLPVIRPASQGESIEELAQRHPVLREAPAMRENAGMEYRIIREDMDDTEFYRFAHDDGRFVLVLNQNHPFFRKVYLPLADADDKDSQATRAQLDLMLLAAARAEAEAASVPERKALAGFRKTWSDNLATFLNR